MNTVYKHPDDIDLWLGGLIEGARGDGLVGPTFGDIIADQFSKFRQGDRYFYEHSTDTNPGAFTPDQLAEIKKVSMARLICDNSDALQEQPPKAFVQVRFPGYVFSARISLQLFCCCCCCRSIYNLQIVHDFICRNAPVPCGQLPAMNFLPWRAIN